MTADEYGKKWISPTRTRKARSSSFFFFTNLIRKIQHWCILLAIVHVARILVIHFSWHVRDWVFLFHLSDTDAAIRQSELSAM